MLESICILRYSETLMEKDEEGTLYETDSPVIQNLAFRDMDLLNEYLENERNKDIYDGHFDNDYDNWLFIKHMDFLDEDDLYKGFERIFRSEENDRQIIYSITIEDAVLVD